MKENGNLKEIALDYNEKIGEKGIHHLEECFYKCFSIDLDSNINSKVGIKIIKESIFSNFNLVHCNFNDEELFRFAMKIIQRNKGFIKKTYSIPRMLNDMNINFK